MRNLHSDHRLSSQSLEEIKESIALEEIRLFGLRRFRFRKRRLTTSHVVSSLVLWWLYQPAEAREKILAEGLGLLEKHANSELPQPIEPRAEYWIPAGPSTQLTGHKDTTRADHVPVSGARPKRRR